MKNKKKEILSKFLSMYTSLVTQLCLTLFDTLDYSQPGSSVHVTFQARILEWVAVFLLQGIFLTQRSSPVSPSVQADSSPAEPSGKLTFSVPPLVIYYSRCGLKTSLARNLFVIS